MNLKYDEPLSRFAFKFNLRRYTKEKSRVEAEVNESKLRQEAENARSVEAAVETAAAAAAVRAAAERADTERWERDKMTSAEAAADAAAVGTD